MKEKKNIDRIFQEKFKDFEALPDSTVWKHIEKDLKKEKRILPLFPLWVKLSGVAALLTLLFLAGKFLFFPPTDSNTVKTVKSRSTQPKIDTPQTSPLRIPAPILNTQLTETKKPETPTRKVGKKTSAQPVYTVSDRQQKPESLSTGSKRNSAHKDSPLKPVKKIELPFLMPPSFQDELNSIARLQSVETQKEDGQKREKPAAQGRSLFDEIAHREETEANEEAKLDEEPKNRFVLQPHIAPIYYSSIGGGSALDPRFAENRTKGKVTTAYGINFDYRISNRIQLRSGISKVDLQYNTPDIAYLSSQPSMGIQALNTDKKINDAVIISTVSRKTQLQASPQRTATITTASAYTEGELHQEMSYLEIPLEVVYTVLDHRFGIHLIGGTSALVLNNDNIQIHSTLETKELGRANNINSLSFTGNLGVGFSYRISPFMDINIEPTFKYQFNGFSGKTGDFRPYYLGLYSGVRFKF